MGKEFQDIRTGVIGVGSMGSNHVRIYDKISNLIGVHDINEKRSRKIADWKDCKHYSSLGGLLGEVDAVSIAVPTYLHRTIAEQVAEAGVHMLVEKPLATTVADSQRIIDVSKEYNVVLGVGHTERYNPVVDYVLRSLKEHRLGKPITLLSTRVSNYPERVKDVGVILDLATHDIDVMCSLVGKKPESVYASGGRSLPNTGFEDHATIQLDFDGITGTCIVNWLTPMKIRTLEIITTTNYVKLDYQKHEAEDYSSEFHDVDNRNLFQPPITVISHKISVARQPEDDILMAVKEEPLGIELTDFLGAISERREPLVTGSYGLIAVEVAVAALESLKTGQSVKLH